MKRPNAATVFLLAGSLFVMFCTNALPTNDNKNAGGLRLSAPVESPNGVHFSWTGGQTGTTYGIYRRMHGDANWERIKMGLTGVSGAADVEGFTLDRTYDYEIRAEAP